MGQTLYLECYCGISGDMTVAALLDLGADVKVLRQVLDSMPVSGFEVEISRVKKAGLDVCDFNVMLDEGHENHDHDMEYLHGVGHEHGHEHEHKHHNGHHHEHHHDHEHIHSHEHRGLPEIQKIIRGTDMSERAKSTALRIFDILAKAEAKAHGVEIENVHFHEVGAVDSIVDITAVAVCLDNLDVTEVIIPGLCEGKGTVRCQHGILPVPVPAVANIVQMNGLSLQPTEVFGELVTPTGAAVAAAIKTKDELPEKFTVLKTGMGGGKRKYERPSILRAMLIQEEKKHEGDFIYKLETNIDDCTGEMLGYVMERLFDNGAAEVNYTPVFMKKNRPAYLLTVLCKEELVSRLENIIFKETTTIGIRKVKMERTVLKREMETVRLPMGEIMVKKCVLPDGTIRKYPEYETVAQLAQNTGKPIREIIDVTQSAYDKLKKLEDYLKSLGSVAVAFSSGVDSTFLLKVAKDVLGDNVIAITANSHSFPKWELEEAKSFCKEIGIRQFICDFDELSVEGFCENPPNRCYLCKRELYNKIKEIVRKQNIFYIAEGSNMDDTGDYRPGMAAVLEAGIKSPLQEAGLYKAEIRQLSKKMGLSTWEKPSFACLSSRFAYGEPITEEKLAMVEQAEQLLFDRGFSQARVRIHDRMARIEVLPDELENLVKRDIREEIVTKLKSYGFTYVSMDLKGYRTGSMNESLSI